MAHESVLPLEGIRVLDFSRLLPGPWATQMLGELGADIIKIEQPKLGDPSRHAQPRFKKRSVYFNVVNNCKRSITLDLSKEAGQALAHRLIENADVIIESFRSGVPAKLKIDYETAKKINPRVVYCSITGFGREGPLSHIAGHDLIIQALTGAILRSTEDGNAPVVPAFQAADFAGALMAVIGIMAALARRQKTGLGADLDLSMLDALMYMSPIPLVSALARASGASGEPRQEAFGGNPRYRLYTSADGRPVAVALLETSAWVRFCEHIGREDLIDKTESEADRLSVHGERRERYEKALSEFCAAHTAKEILEMMQDSGIAIGPALSPDEALASENTRERGVLDFVDHSLEGRIPYLVNPLRRAHLAHTTQRPAPQLGEHSNEILQELGLTEADISKLRTDGIV